MKPEVAAAGTDAVRKVLETTLKLAVVPLNETLVVPVNPCPRIWTVFPTLPDQFTMLTNGPRPMSRL